MPKDKLTYKEKNGTSRVGGFLRSIGKGDLLKKVFGSAAEILTGDITGAVETLLKSTDELSNEQRDFALKLLESDVKENEEISKRWAYDMNSDSWLSKNVRPLTLIFLSFTTILLIFLDSSINKIVVENEWIYLLKTLLITVYAAYFGGRSYEKTKKI